MTAIVDVGVACSGAQQPAWWIQYATELMYENEQDGIKINKLYNITSAMPDHGKNNILSESVWDGDNMRFEQKRRMTLTDANRQEMTGMFLNDSVADWIWMIDDDTLPPIGALQRLLNTGHPFVAGLYFNGKPPHNPIAYMRDRRPGSGLYKAFYGYARGTLQKVDAVGMGCTLVHRSVFEKILENYIVYERPTGSLYPVHKDDVYRKDIKGLQRFPRDRREFVANGWLVTRVQPPKPPEEGEEDRRAFPFFSMEFGRTEDYHFCEMAERVGIKPYLDTTIECQHLKIKEFGVQQYQEQLTKMLQEQPEAQ